MNRNVLNLVNANRGSIPISFLLGWIKKESGGRIMETTSLNERGYFQLHPAESRDLGLDHNRLSTDAAYSIGGGIKLIQSYQRKVERLGFEAGTDLYWHMVKFEHSIGSGNVSKLLNDMRTHGVEPSSWEAIQSYAHENESRLKHDLQSSPSKWVRNVDDVFSLGQQEFQMHHEIFDVPTTNTDSHSQTPENANITDQRGHAATITPPETDQNNFTPDSANFSNEQGNQVYVDSVIIENNFSPVDANISMPDGQVLHYGADSNQADQSQQSNVDSDTSLPDGITTHYGADSNQTDQSQQSNVDSNTSLPDGTPTYYDEDSYQIEQLQQSGSTDANISIPDGTTTHYGAESNQAGLSAITEFSSQQWFDPYHHAPIVNHVDPFNVAIHYGADSNQIDHSLQTDATDANIGLLNESTVPYGADSNQVDHLQQIHSPDANFSLPDGGAVHYGADSNQVDHSQQSHASDNSANSTQIDSHLQGQVVHDDGNQSVQP